MNFIKVKFLKDGVVSGRAYTYKTDLDLKPGDKVQIDEHRTGIVTEEAVDMAWVETYGAENIKAILGKCETELKEGEE